MCEVMNISRSGYHKWGNRPESERKKRRKALTRQVLSIFLESRHLYGSPKIAKELERKGSSVCQKQSPVLGEKTDFDPEPSKNTKRRI